MFRRASSIPVRAQSNSSSYCNSAIAHTLENIRSFLNSSQGCIHRGWDPVRPICTTPSSQVGSSATSDTYVDILSNEIDKHQTRVPQQNNSRSEDRHAASTSLHCHRFILPWASSSMPSFSSSFHDIQCYSFYSLLSSLELCNRATLRAPCLLQEALQ